MACPETYLEVLEAYWGGRDRLQLTVGARTLIEETLGNFLYILFLFLFLFLLPFFWRQL